MLTCNIGVNWHVGRRHSKHSSFPFILLTSLFLELFIPYRWRTTRYFKITSDDVQMQIVEQIFIFMCTMCNLLMRPFEHWVKWTEMVCEGYKRVQPVTFWWPDRHLVDVGYIYVQLVTLCWPSEALKPVPYGYWVMRRLRMFKTRNRNTGDLPFTKIHLNYMWRERIWTTRNFLMTSGITLIIKPQWLRCLVQSRLKNVSQDVNVDIKLSYLLDIFVG